jgi:hypothetical protein
VLFRSHGESGDVFAKIERLAELRAKGILADGEFEQKKAEYKQATEQGDFRDLPNGPQPGKPKKAEPFDYSSLPKGNPMRIAAAALAGLGGDDEDIAMILGNPVADVNAAIQTATPAVPALPASTVPVPTLPGSTPPAPLPVPLPVVAAETPTVTGGDWAAVGQSMGSRGVLSC